MPIYKPSELQQFLAQMGIAPKKWLSQNFLIDGNIIRKIVKTASLKPEEWVIEIGSGPGSLTEELLKEGARVLAIEKDEPLANALRRLNPEADKLEIHCADIMEFPLEEWLKTHLPPNQKAKVIANLPYHLTTPIIAHLVTLREKISSLILMVQHEVAQRFTAVPGTSAYSSFTVYLNFYANPHYAFTVNQNCFYPQPRVNSAIVVFDLKTPPFVSNQEKFFLMTRTAFEHRRKMLRSSLRDLYPPELMMAALEESCLDPLARPEQLSLEEFLKIFEILNR